MNKFSKSLLIVVLVILLGLAGLIGWLTLVEYNPDPVVALDPITREATAPLPAGATIDVLSWNVGYAGLGAESDFVMDGGQNICSADENTVRRYLKGIEALTSSEEYDLVILQEVDTDSTRTYSIDQTAKLAYGTSYHALNFSCPFVPNPQTYLYNPIGKVNSGLLTVSRYQIANAERVALPCPFSWPLRIVNLKRCLLVSYLPIEGSEQKLVLVNLHLEAYDDGEGKLAQTKALNDFLQDEYAKGNYVIAGGDFNQTFPGGLDSYPVVNSAFWAPGTLTEDMLPAGWSFAYSLDVPSCRLLNQPFNPADTVNTQYYVIDGFILSPNVELETVETLDLGFADSDHNPVHISVRLAG